MQKLLIVVCVAAGDIISSSSAMYKMYAFTTTHHLHHKRRLDNRIPKFQLQAQDTEQKKNKKNPILELVKVVTLGNQNNREEIDSVDDFDSDLAKEIQDALSSAGVDNNNVKEVTTADKEVNTLSTNNESSIKQEDVQPPITKAPKYVPEVLPPHTALAKVLANQYGIDLNSVTPSAKGLNNKITAEDVEYHAWKLSQPPCTADALKIAYSLGIDLSDLYDDEDRETVMDMSDVQLFVEHSRSLKMSSQVVKRGSTNLDNDTQSSRKRMKKMSAIDKRMEAKMEQLSEKAMKVVSTVTGGIVNQVQSQARGITDTDGIATKDIQTVEDFDIDLASEIKEALSIASNINDKNGEDENDLESLSTSANLEEAKSIPASFSEEELEAMTCVQLKALLGRRGMKRTGKKTDLVKRLLGEVSRDVDGDDRSDSPLFFAN